MRSRYTAYQLEDAAYLYETAHQDYRTGQTEAGIKNWASENSWNKLEILDTLNGKVNDQEGIVEFKAYFTDKNGVDQVHHERSGFLKEAGKWFYTSGVFNPENKTKNESIPRNGPCPCGSGKKYKKCCA